MKVWITTDTHWHQDGRKIGRPEDHTSVQFREIRSIVGPDDLIIHCGDVTWRPNLLLEDMEKLPGKWVLVCGNHDKKSLTWYMRHGFAFACESFVFKKVLFTHAPANELPADTRLNVHGHLHNGDHHAESYTPRPFHKLLAIESTRYRPVSFDKFVGSTPFEVNG